MSPYMISNPDEGKNVSTTLGHVAPHLDQDPVTLPTTLDPFTITTSNGFMPFQLPIVNLPPAFNALTKLVEEMPVQKLDGTPGLLATYQLGPKVDGGALPDLSNEIDNLTTADGKPDLHLVSAAFRDYSFLASAYLLEPCWEEWQKTQEGYGLGRQVLPRCIAGPIVKTAKM
jgi:indoleamine 2,3-dioxygenase